MYSFNSFFWGGRGGLPPKSKYFYVVQEPSSRKFPEGVAHSCTMHPCYLGTDMGDMEGTPFCCNFLVKIMSVWGRKFRKVVFDPSFEKYMAKVGILGQPADIFDPDPLSLGQPIEPLPTDEYLCD